MIVVLIIVADLTTVQNVSLQQFQLRELSQIPHNIHCEKVLWKYFAESD